MVSRDEVEVITSQLYAQRVVKPEIGRHDGGLGQPETAWPTLIDTCSPTNEMGSSALP